MEGWGTRGAVAGAWGDLWLVLTAGLGGARCLEGWCNPTTSVLNSWVRAGRTAHWGGKAGG